MVIILNILPQAFTNIYELWNDLENDYYLVIEEINREIVLKYLATYSAIR